MVSVSITTIVVAAIGGLLSIAVAIIGFMTSMMITDIKKSIDTLFAYNDATEKLVNKLRADFEALNSEHKVRHEK